jgi:hypothetical protein
MVLWTGPTDYTYVSAIIPVSRIIHSGFKRTHSSFRQLILLSRYTMQSRSIQVSYVVSSLLAIASETTLTPMNIACLPLLRPLVKTVVENRTFIFSLQTSWFASRSIENDMDEIPLRQLNPQQRIHPTAGGVTNCDNV